jgi:uncharacterized protein
MSRRIAMMILEEAAELARERLGEEIKSLTIERLVVGLFFTGVKLSNGAGGVCFTPIKAIPEAVCCPSSAGRIFDPMAVRGMAAEEVLTGLSSREPIKTATGIATLNALSATCWEKGFLGGLEIREDIDAQDEIRMEQSKSVALVGAFTPILKTLKKRGGTWWVLEQDPSTLKSDEMPHYVPATKSDDTIRQADVLIVTGVTLVNHTLDTILERANPSAEVAVIGPSASLLPEPLFRRGVRIVGGVWVRRTDQLLDVLAAGGSGYHFFGSLATRTVIEREPRGL